MTAAQPAAERPRLKLSPWQPRESQVLRACLDFCCWCPDVAFAWRCNTGAGRVVKRDGTQSQWMQWGFPGAPDIHGFLIDGRALFVETKQPSVKAASDDQAAFLALAARHGCVAVVARGHEDLKRAIDAAMGRTR